MPTTVLAQVVFQRDNDIFADAVVNTWHFRIHAVDPATQVGSIRDSLEAFYGNIMGVMSPVLSPVADVKFYDLLEPAPRVPIDTDTLTITPDSSAPLPSECAVCLSYHGELVSGANSARRRGRIFLGPFSVDALQVATEDGRVSDALRSAIAGAAETLRTDGSGGTWEWAVFSPTTAGAPPWNETEVDNATFVTVGGHVDNAFDTIRSRGSVATARSIFP